MEEWGARSVDEFACVRASVQGSVGGSGIASSIHTTPMLYSPLSSARSFVCKPARNFIVADHSLLALPLPPSCCGYVYVYMCDGRCDWLGWPPYSFLAPAGRTPVEFPPLRPVYLVACDAMYVWRS